MSAVAFWVLAVGAVAFGIAVFVVDSMARATFALLASFLCVGAELLLIDLQYLGVLVVLMMIMEMLIMAVFMIMYMMNPAGLMPMTMVHNNRGALIISIAVFLGLAAGIFLTPWPERSGRIPRDPTFQLGEAIMGSKMLVMMVIGLGILSTMIASVVLATHRGRYGDALGPRHSGTGSTHDSGGGSAGGSTHDSPHDSPHDSAAGSTHASAGGSAGGSEGGSGGGSGSGSPHGSADDPVGGSGGGSGGDAG